GAKLSLSRARPAPAPEQRSASIENGDPLRERLADVDRAVPARGDRGRLAQRTDFDGGRGGRLRCFATWQRMPIAADATRAAGEEQRSSQPDRHPDSGRARHARPYTEARS